MAKHDAYRQIGYIQQALSQNRKPMGIFLGAGCPLAVRVDHQCELESKKEFSFPIIPDIAGLTTIIIHSVHKKPAFLPAFYVCRVLLTHKDSNLK